MAGTVNGGSRIGHHTALNETLRTRGRLLAFPGSFLGCLFRAAIVTPSPIRSPSLSSTTSPRWMPILNSRPARMTGIALDHAVLHLDGAAHGIDHAAPDSWSSAT